MEKPESPGSPFADVLRYVGQKSGLTFSPHRLSSAEAGIRSAMHRVGIKDMSLYLELLERGDLSMDDLLAELTVGETYFFREPAQFEWLRHEVLPAFNAKKTRSGNLRVWSAACATGEEAYSLGILLSETGRDPSDIVLGTDISRSRLSLARKATYRSWSLRSLGKEDVKKYFLVQGDTFILLPDFQRRVEFQYLNLAEDTYPAISTAVWGMDIIMCRNVLIYFDKPTVAKVSARLLDTLSESGWLLLGASDPILSDLVKCEVVQTRAGLVYRKSHQTTIAVRFYPDSRSVIEERDMEVIEQKPASVEADEREELVFETHLEDTDELNVHFEIELESTPESPQDRLRTALSQKNYDVVVAVAEELQAEGDTSEGTAVALVRALANLGRIKDAARVCEAALDKNRMSSELLYLHAVLLNEFGRYSDAIMAGRRALYLDRSMIVAHLALATSLKRNGLRAEARRSLTNAETLLLQLDPTAIVPASEGEPAGRLLAMARVHRNLLTNELPE